MRSTITTRATGPANAGVAFVACVLGFAMTVALVAALVAPKPSPRRATTKPTRSSRPAARSAFQDGRYDDALARFQEAYALSPRSELLYNIGQSADRLRRDSIANALDGP